MLILLPPSEGKQRPRRGRALDLSRLDLPELTDARAEVLESLVELCRDAPADEAMRVLGLGSTQEDEVRRNAQLRTAATTRADRVYSGVLYEALGLGSLDPPARRRASRWLLVTSALFGLVRPQDPIAAYRLSGDVTLPGLGKVAAHWRAHLGSVVTRAAGSGLVVDLRSGTYAAFWKPDRELADQVVTVRVLQERDGRRSVVSHFNKATKGRLVRSVLQHGTTPRSASGLAEVLTELGWRVEQEATSLDVIVTEV